MTTKMISEETLQPQAQEETRITPRDLRRVFWRSFQMEFSWNYERQMNLAFVYALIPVLKKLYPRKEELARALKRHLVFFNTTPHIVTLLLGITTAMEEKNSHQKNMDATAIDNVKASLMGPLAGLGDSFFWGTLRLIATGIGTSLALKGNILGPILFLLVFNVPHILVRFMAIRHEDELKLSRRIAASWVVISMAVAVFIGIVGHAVSAAGRIPSLEGSATETVIVRLSDLLSSYGILPAVVAGCILAGILAATMSTADSQLLAAASAFSENVLQDLLGVKLTPKQNMLAARLTVVVIAFIAIFLAADPNSNVFKIVSFAWAGFGATFGPAMLCALFWRRSNRQGIMAGLVVGGVMIFVWKFLVAPMGGIFNIYELLPAFLCALCAIVVVSLLTPAPEKEITDMFDSYNT